MSWFKSAWEAASSLSPKVKLGLGVGAAAAAVGYYLFGTRDRRQNTYFRYQDTRRNLSRRKTLPDRLGNMMQQTPLVYGLEDESREPLRNQYLMPPGFEKRVVIPSSISTVGPYTADNLNNVTWRGYRKRGKNPNLSIYNPKTSQSINEKLQRRMRSQSVIEKMQHHDPSVRKRKEKFQRSKQMRIIVENELGQWREGLPRQYKKSVHDRFSKALLRHPRYSPSETFQEDDQEIMEREGMNSVGKAKFQSQTRRSSKFGLEFQRKQGKDVAFMLDFPSFGKQSGDYGFQINKTKTGNRAGGGQSSARVPITTSELRKAYRDKDAPGTQPTFFVGGKKVPAPWVQRSDQWAKYGRYRLNKYREAWETVGTSHLQRLEQQEGYKNASDHNARANFLKQAWLNSGRGIYRKKDKPKLVSGGRRRANSV